MTVRQIERGLLYLLEQSILNLCSYLTQKEGFEITFLPTLPSEVCMLFNYGVFDVAIMFSARFLSGGHPSVSLVLFAFVAVLHDRKSSSWAICTARCTAASGL